jgi:hypothetical protein
MYDVLISDAILKEFCSGIETRERLQTQWLLVYKGTIPTERPPLVDEIQCQLLRIRGCRVVSAADPPR